LADSLSS